jgi:4-hydroxybenzoate polyprenyltransferase
MKRPLTLLFSAILFCLSSTRTAVDAFSARIHRPWESTPLRPRRHVAIRYTIATGEETNNKDKDDNEDEEEDDKEVFSLQDSNELEAAENVTISTKPSSPKSNSAVKVTNTSATKFKPKPFFPPLPPTIGLQQKQPVTAAALVTSLQSTTEPTVRSCLPELIKIPGVVLFHMLGIWLALQSMVTFLQPTPEPTVQSCLPELIKMTRPSNNPGVVLFHMLGIWLALQSNTATAAASTAFSASLFWKTLTHPSMLVVLCALLLTSSTSMLVNDYYDYKLGHDTLKPFQPLVHGQVPLKVAKRFLTMLYAAALICVTLVPGVPARLAVVTGLMLTWWYTKHLKPKTWLKNVVCASLIALSPLTSGAAVLALLGNADALGGGAISSSAAAAMGAVSSSSSWQGMVPLLRVVGMLFCGILGREIFMDCNDVPDDTIHGVRTVPVVHGRKFASIVGFGCTLSVSVLAMAGPLFQVLARTTMTTTMTTSVLETLPLWLIRRLVLATVGSTMQVRRAYQVLVTEGKDKSVVERAVNEGLLSVVVLLGSFV